MSVAVSVHDGTDIHSRSSSGRGLVVLIHTNPHVIHTHTHGVYGGGMGEGWMVGLIGVLSCVCVYR